jgi:Spy/CpxP family protein refolding chaperone
MRSRTLWATAALAALAWAGAASAQPPRGPGGPGGPERALDQLRLSGKALEKAEDALDANRRAARRLNEQVRDDLLTGLKSVLSADQLKQFTDDLDRAPGPGPGGFGRGGRGISADDLVERVMAYDKNKTGKVRKEDLPERLQHLVDEGDTNKDGALDRDELKALAAKLSRDGGRGRGPGGFGGPPRGPGGPGGRPDPRAAEFALDDLKLTGETKEKAFKAVDAYRAATRKAADQVREDLLKRMKEALTADQLKEFTEALDRRPPPGGGRGGPGGFDRRRPGDGDGRPGRPEAPFDGFRGGGGRAGGGGCGAR